MRTSRSERFFIAFRHAHAEKLRNEVNEFRGEPGCFVSLRLMIELSLTPLMSLRYFAETGDSGLVHTPSKTSDCDDATKKKSVLIDRLGKV